MTFNQTKKTPMLSDKQKELYCRQLLISGFTELDQQKLIDAKVLVIGAGGLGSPVLYYLTAAGVNNIGIVENDNVVLHNLQRQILYTETDIDKSKGNIAVNKLKELNKDCNPVHYNLKWNDENAEEIARQYEIILDCTDNIAARISSDKISKKLGIPFVFGAVNGWELQVSVFNYRGGKSYCETFGVEQGFINPVPIGVIGVTPAVTGSIMASEAIKVILEKGEILTGKMLHYSLLTNKMDIYNL